MTIPTGALQTYRTLVEKDVVRDGETVHLFPGDILVDGEQGYEDEVYMDSNILSGHGIGVVSNIGMKTAIGKIAEMVQEDDDETPLKIRVSKLGNDAGIIGAAMLGKK